jgi:hypothetical protein
MPRCVSGALCLRHGSAGFQQVLEPVIVALDLVKQPPARAPPQAKLQAIQVILSSAVAFVERFRQASRQVG